MAREKDIEIEIEQKRLAKEKELVLLRMNDAIRKQEQAEIEKQKLEDAKRNLNLRYASIPSRQDLYPYPYFREFYGGPLYQQTPMVNTIIQPPLLQQQIVPQPIVHGCLHGTTCATPSSLVHAHLIEDDRPVSCMTCGKEKTTYILPSIRGSSGRKSQVFKIQRLE